MPIAPLTQTWRNEMRGARVQVNIKWPATDEGWCEYWKMLDTSYGTTTDSPLHHDNRCAIHSDLEK